MVGGPKGKSTTGVQKKSKNMRIVMEFGVQMRSNLDSLDICKPHYCDGNQWIHKSIWIDLNFDKTILNVTRKAARLSV